MTPLAILFLLLVAAMLGRWVLAAREDDPELIARQTAEIARLREELDRLGGEVRRLAEEQSFLMRLLAPGRQAAADLLPEARPPTPAENEESA